MFRFSDSMRVIYHNCYNGKSIKLCIYIYIVIYDKSQFLEWVCPTSVSISGLEFSWLDINPTRLMLLVGIWFKFILGLAYSIVHAFLIILKRRGGG